MALKEKEEILSEKFQEAFRNSALSLKHFTDALEKAGKIGFSVKEMEEERRKHMQVILVSGGIDSYIMYHWLTYQDHLPKLDQSEIHLVYFYLSSKYSEKELEVVKRIFPQKTIIDRSLDFRLREYGENAIIPYRNLIMAAQATTYGNTIWMAGLADDRASDKSEASFKKMSEILTELNPKGEEVKVLSPFWNLTKAGIINWYLRCFPQTGPRKLRETTSCYDHDKHYCGRCPSCFRKWVALFVNGIKLEFTNRELIKKYVREALDEKTTMHQERRITTLKAVSEYILAKD